MKVQLQFQSGFLRDLDVPDEQIDAFTLAVLDRQPIKLFGSDGYALINTTEIPLILVHKK